MSNFSRKVSSFISEHSGAEVETSLIDLNGNVVTTGSESAMRKVAKWAGWLASKTGRSISAVVEIYEDDPGFAVCRINGLPL